MSDVLRRVCVFCGSSPGNRPAYPQAADELAARLVDRGIGLVYGGARVGLMGTVADAVLARGGEAIGVCPGFLADVEVAHARLTEMHLVDTLAERKALMEELSDAFIALPGGLGTLEELFEMATLGQLHVHDKPVGVLEVDGYWDDLRAFLDRAVDDRLLSPANLGLLHFDDDPDRLLDTLASFVPTFSAKWLDRA